MSESIAPTVDSLTAELEVLRKTNSELLKKIHDRTTKATELESAVSELQGKLSASNATIHELTVAAPLKAMAASLSVDPDFFIDQFSKSYKVELIEGKLTLQTTDGKPVTNGAGEVVAFERQALVDLLTKGDTTQAKVFSSIVIGSLASGANGESSVQGSRASSSPKPSFGLGMR